MERDSDDDVLILYDETCDQIITEPSNDDLFRQIDEVLSEEPQIIGVNLASAPSMPAVLHSRQKRAFTPVQAPSVVPNVTAIVPNVTITPMVASTSRLNAGLLNRLGPVVTPLASRLGPPSTSVAPVQSTLEEEVVETKTKRPRGPDRRPEVYKALTQQGLAELNLPELVRPDVNRPFYAALKYNQNEQLWRKLTHKDRTAREFSEWHLHLQTPKYMPKISYQNARSLIEVTYKVAMDHKLSVYEVFEGQKVGSSDGRVIAFEQEVRLCGFMSFDTEGGGNLPSADKTKGNR